MPHTCEICCEACALNNYYGAVADLAPGYIATIIQYRRLVSAIEQANDMDEVDEIVARHKEWIKSKEVKASEK